jgi:DNA modification methylase
VRRRYAMGKLKLKSKHRLLCGDSTSKENVARLMDGKKADMCFTDPPYGVGYEGGSKKRKKLEDDHIGTDIYSIAIPIIASNVVGACYTWFTVENSLAFLEVVDRVGQIHSCIIWVKNNSAFNMNIHYKQRHEPCLYWKPKGTTLCWSGNNKEDTVWELDRESKNEYHPTQKPVALAVRAISNHTAKTVLDLFLGSGSTLIACEQLNRKCYGMEIDPLYCDVIVKRWENLTGEKAVLDG